MPEVKVGPMLRHVGETDATIWVEADEACEVEILGRSQRTFEVDGHHYTLVCLEVGHTCTGALCPITDVSPEAMREALERLRMEPSDPKAEE